VSALVKLPIALVMKNKNAFYSVFFGNKARKKLGELFQSLPQKSKHFILVDSHSLQHCYPNLLELEARISQNIEILEVNPGEKSKSIATAEMLCKVMLELQADKHSVLFNLGGGVVSDLGGFVASVFKRGITYYNVPTSLLAMIDASVGGKTAVNAGMYKNQIGTFYPPKAVFVLPEFLETLPKKELKSAWGELIKHGLISGGIFWDEVSKTRLHSSFIPQDDLIEKAIAVKVAVVKKDPYEENLRKVLNLGHTFGHAFEGMALNSKKPMPHGIAVAIGLCVESCIAYYKLGLTKENLAVVFQVVKRICVLPQIENTQVPILWQFMLADKKNAEGEVLTVLLSDFGKVEWKVPISIHDLQLGITLYNSLA
jgi:3-dehydroquinate synthase